jgi:hypothetical protein
VCQCEEEEMGPPDQNAEQQDVMHFHVVRFVLTDQVPTLVPLAPSGHYVMAIKNLKGPVTNYTYRPEQIAPYREAIDKAIASQRVFVVETDSTERTWPHNPDPRGRIEERILRAIAERQFAEGQP